MSTATAETTMGKKKPAGPESPADSSTKAVKIDRAVAAKAQMIATDRGLTLTDYVSETLRGAVESDWGKMVRRVSEGGEEPRRS